jgi:hypothetical protein
MNQEEVVALMRSSKDSADWNKNCKTVKAAHGGDYPPFWFAAIVLSGLSEQVLGSEAGIKSEEIKLRRG